MSDPTDPDTEDRRPDHERDDDRESELRDAYEDDEDRLEEEPVKTSQLGLFDDDLLDFDLDDLRDMEGPDA